MPSEKRRLISKLLNGPDRELADVLRQIDRALSVGEHMLTQAGGQVRTRWNTDTDTIERFENGKWIPVTGVAAPAAAASSTPRPLASASTMVSGAISGLPPLANAGANQLKLQYLGSLAVDASGNLYVVNDGHTHATQYLGLTAQAADSHMVDGQHASAFAAAAHGHGAADLTLDGDLVPEDDSTYELGSALKAWLHIYVDEVIAGALTILGTKNTTLVGSATGTDKDVTLPDANCTIVGVVTKADTGDPSGVEGLMCINTFDNTLKVYAEAAWRQIATW